MPINYCGVKRATFLTARQQCSKEISLHQQTEVAQVEYLALLVREMRSPLVESGATEHDRPKPQAHHRLAPVPAARRSRRAARYSVSPLPPTVRPGRIEVRAPVPRHPPAKRRCWQDVKFVRKKRVRA
jgi:hypothetical protein